VPAAPDGVATWTAPGPPAPPGTTVEVPVVDRGEGLGTVTVDMPAGRDLRAADSQLLADLADQAALAFRNARLAGELAHQVEALNGRTVDLAESRRRLVSAGDAERQRLERAIARDVVPHLEPLPGRLETLAESAPGRLDPAAVEPLVTSATAALEALREITRGVFPAQLARSGLAAALGSLLGRTGSGRLVVTGIDGGGATRRYGDRVEAAAYFCVAEAVQELGPPVEVELDDGGEELRLVVRGRDAGELSLAHLRDRVETVGGVVARRTAGDSTALDVRLPVSAAAVVPA
jgi:signal transduction histidine kinase